MKRYRRTAIVLLILTCGAAVGLRYFLTSSFLARQVARHLRTRFGLAVSVDGIRVGLHGTTLFNVRLAGDNGNLPLLRVDRLETDLTLWKLLCGQTRPQEITLQGAHLTLCFDQSGEWVVPVPDGPAAGSVIPRAHLHAGQLTVQREGWATLEISGIDAEITDAGQLLVSGSLHDTVWEGWAFAAAGLYPGDPRMGFRLRRRARRGRDRGRAGDAEALDRQGPGRGGAGRGDP